MGETATGELTVAGVLRGWSSSRGSHSFVVCDEQRLTYAQADSESAALARGLISIGAAKGTHVGLIQPNGTDFVVAMLAAGRIGAVLVPVSTFSTPGELSEILGSADVEIVLCAGEYRSHDFPAKFSAILGAALDGGPLFAAALPQLRHLYFTGSGAVPPGLGVGALLASGVAVADDMLTALEDDVCGSDVLTIVHTSGSASAPKGVVHTHRSLLEHQGNLNAIRQLGADDVLFSNSPFFWIGGFGFSLLGTLVAGATLVCSNAIVDSDVLDVLEREKPTIANGFAAPIAHLADDPSFARRDLSSIRRGNLYPLMAPPWRPEDPGLRHNMLGMTEAGGTYLLSGDESDQPEHRRGSFGRPAPGFETKIVDPETGSTLDVGAVGELCIRGRYLMQGYYGLEREAAFDADSWFHTGDLMHADADGFLYFTGRHGSMIKTSGANVSPLEVQAAIAKVADGLASHVVGIPDGARGELVGAVLVADTDTAPDDETLRALLRDQLSSYKIPHRFVRMPAADLPVRSSGKVDLNRLAEAFDG